MAVDREAIRAARRSEGKNIVASARETARKAGYAAETMLMETGTLPKQVAETIANEASDLGCREPMATASFSAFPSAAWQNN